MTVDDRKAFDQSFNRLAKSGLIHDVDTAAKAIYFDTLSDLPIWAIERAEFQLRRSPVKFFTSAIWHEQAVLILRDQRRRDSALLASRRLLPVQCDLCQDSGMRLSEPASDRLTHCECRDTNENYQIGRARLRMADEEQETPSIPNHESKQITDTVRDFKRLSTGGDQ